MFTCAKIRNGGSCLGNYLTANDYYSFRTVEISGYRFDGIFNDAVSGKLGTVTTATDAVPDADESGVSVTSIIYAPAPFASSAGGAPIRRVCLSAPIHEGNSDFRRVPYPSENQTQYLKKFFEFLRNGNRTVVNPQ
jgi:hypothetical protein